MERRDSAASWETESWLMQRKYITETYWGSERCAGMSTDERHKIYLSDEEDTHEYWAGVLVHMDMVSAVLGCWPVSSRLISVSLLAAPVGKDAQADWRNFCELYCNDKTNERGLRILEFGTL